MDSTYLWDLGTIEKAGWPSLWKSLGYVKDRLSLWNTSLIIMIEARKTDLSIGLTARQNRGFYNLKLLYFSYRHCSFTCSPSNVIAFWGHKLIQRYTLYIDFQKLPDYLSFEYFPLDILYCIGRNQCTHRLFSIHQNIPPFYDRTIVFAQTTPWDVSVWRRRFREVARRSTSRPSVVDRKSVV